MHLGNIYNFILTWWYVRSKNGVLALRIDDADELRTKDEWLADIFDTLTWLGLTYDEGPKDIEDFKARYSQQIKKEKYREILDDRHFFFSCSCSRKAIEEHGHKPECFEARASHTDVEETIRLNLGPTYPILWRKDDIPAYHLTSIIDDQDMTDLIRGDDLLESTVLQEKISTLLGLNFPKSCYHHKILKTIDEQKLSKSQGSESVRKQFQSKEELFSRLAPTLQTASFAELEELLLRPFPKEVLSPL